MLQHAFVVAAALAGAVFAAVGIVVRQRATMDVPHDQGVSTVMVSTLLRRRLWWAGTAAAVTGYAFQAVALAFGSILLVAPLMVSALLFALPLSARLAHRRVSRAEWGWASLLTVALGVFVSLARTKPGDYDGATLPAVIVAGISLLFVSGCLLGALRLSDWRRAILLAVGVGVLFGVVAVLTKLVMHIVREGSVVRLLTTPVLYVVFAVGIIATLLQQSAFHAGSLRASVPAMLVLEPVVAVLLGEVVLGDHLAVSKPVAVVLAMAVGAMAAATIALGRDEGAWEDELEATAQTRGKHGG
ncbi:DMT family transporter [Mycobacterium sp. CVI_P3]|uniref:DMT family transporter n=1 Tax=Mycobacterium pinniadriaticum TaxID=2994102 RepID=A0ABT3SAN3_9MYCO|nr:DMT family transporter [Mycobacterium pinniadriaticum]MCX2929556.1 DMT family transporter [Mycobacterium pinniadriaticum]MCX2935980.1 DMT family transporter [Mycobacterium pinniadriaticum]